MREIRAASLDLMGIYHSHPSGNNEPSSRDIERAYYPDVAYFIVSAQTDQKPVRAFSIREGQVTEVEIEILIENRAIAASDFQHYGGDVVVLATVLGKAGGLGEKKVERVMGGFAVALQPRFHAVSPR